MSETTEERTRERSRRALDLFEEAQALPPREREELLRSTGERDAPLRQTVADLLAAHGEIERTEFLEAPAISYQPAASNPLALVGQRVGAYQITDYLAQGGMGWVFLGERADGQFHRRVAIKVITPELAGGTEDSQSFRRFRREVQILADLKHPNLVALYDAGRLGDGRPYIVMEYVQGETLQAWLKRHGPMPPAQVVEVIRQAGAGLDAAHAAGVIHRDIKPGNIILTGTSPLPEIKVLDFGIASRQQHDDSTLSRTQGLIGTLPYMSPEQLRPEPGVSLTPASDVFALGLVAYELLTGRVANNGHATADIIVKQLQETPPPPSHSMQPANPALAALDSVVMKALAKAPSDRYASATDFAAALATAGRGAQPLTKPTKKMPPPRLNDRKLAPAAAMALLVVVVGTAWWLSRTTHTPELASSAVAPATASPTPARRIAASGPLHVMAEVIDTAGRPLSQSLIAIFHAGITQPEPVTKTNAVVLRTTERGTAETTTEAVSAGRHLIKVVRAGYKSRYEVVQLAELPDQPGAVKLRVVLEPE